MDNLYNYLYLNLKEGKNLGDIKHKVESYINDEVKKYCYSKINFTKGNYNRIKLENYSNDIFELVLICWDKNSETKIHDHPIKGCILYLIDGKLEEELFDKSLTILFKALIIVF